MPFHPLPTKGIPGNLLEDGLPDEPIHLHISAVGPGQRSHPPHQHGGWEAFYLFEGEGTLEIEDERLVIRAGESIVFDPRRMHGLVNTGNSEMRYMVILTKE